MRKILFIFLVCCCFIASCKGIKTSVIPPKSSTKIPVAVGFTPTAMIMESPTHMQTTTRDATITHSNLRKPTEKISPTSTISTTLMPKITHVETATPKTGHNLKITTTTPTPTPTPTVTDVPLSMPLPFSLADLSGEYELWVYLGEAGVYQAIDFTSKTAYIVAGPPEPCHLIPFRKDDVICVDYNDKEGILATFTYNILSRVSIPLPISGDLIYWSVWSSNGILFYLSQSGEATDAILYSYDPATQATSMLISGIDITERFVGPFPSSDGKYFTVYKFKDVSIYEISKSGALMLVSPEKLFVSDFNFSWSPISPIFTYGTYSPEIDISDSPCCIILTNLDTGETRQLNQETSFFDYGRGWPSWSPDGEEIAAVHDQLEICIFHLNYTTENCYRLDGIEYQNYQINLPAWSPDGKYIAFIAFDTQRINKDLLIIFDTIRKIFIPILDYEGNLMEPFWQH